MKSYLAISIAILVTSNSFAGDLKRISNGSWIGCDTKSGYDRLVGFATSGDKAAFMRMVLSGQCTPLKPGTKVYLEDLSFFSGMAAVRPKGSTTTLWTALEAVKQ